MRTWWCVLAVAVSLAVALVGCRCSSTPPAGSSSEPPSSDSVDDQASGVVSGILDATALSYLPPETLAVVAGRDAQSFNGWLGSKALREVMGWFPTPFTRLSIYFAINPFDNAVLTELGVDIDRPFGLAVLDPEAQMMAAFATIGDRSLLVAKAREQLTALHATIEVFEEVDPAGGTVEVLRATDLDGPHGSMRPAWIVLRGDTVFLVSGVLPQSMAEFYAHRIATTEPARSLRAGPGFGRGFADSSAPADILGYFNVAALTGEYLVGFEQPQKVDSNPASDRAQKHNREAGADKAAAWHFERPVFEGTRHTELMTLLLPIDGVAARGLLTPAGIDTHVSVVARNQAFPSKLLRPGREHAALLRTLEQPPIAMGFAHTDPEMALELAHVVLKRQLRGARHMARETLGRDLERELLPLFDGDVGVAITGDLLGTPAASLRNGGLSLLSTLGFVLVAGLRDVEAAQAIMDAAMDSVMTRLLVGYDPAKHRLTIPVPGYSGVTIAIVGSNLLVSTDPEAVTRLEGAASAGFAPRAHAGQLTALLERPDAAAALYVDARALALLTAHVSMLGFSPETPAPPDPGALPALEDAYQTLMEADAALRLHADATRARWYRGHVELMEPVGALVLTAHEEGSIVQVDGSLQMRGDGVGAVVDKGIVQAARVKDQLTTDDRTFEQLSAALWEARNAYDAVNVPGLGYP